jgi:hypothetical protein
MSTEQVLDTKDGKYYPANLVVGVNFPINRFLAVFGLEGVKAVTGLKLEAKSCEYAELTLTAHFEQQQLDALIKELQVHLPSYQREILKVEQL